MKISSPRSFTLGQRLRASVLALGMGGALSFAGVPTPAAACGGFFCSAQLPVVQAAERIIFVTHEDETVTAIIQIQYQGPSEEFSWVLPVPGVPEVNVSSNIAFTRLQLASNPNYTLNTEVEGECAPDARFAGGPTLGGVADVDAAPPPSANEQDDGVTVVGGGSVGPYDYEIISVNPDLEDPADVAIEWLTENGYDVGELGPDVLRPYLQDGLNLLAFRLQKDASAGSIRPVMMRWASTSGGQAAGGNPSIPIRPTAVAANEDMGVMVWNVGPFRSVPANYRSLVLNDALINWFNANSNYNDVINIAADEAGGHGFVTEMAQPTDTVSETVWSENDQANWDSIKSSSWQGDEDMLMNRISLYAGWDGLVDAVRDFVPLPENVDADTFAQCPSCWNGQTDFNGLDTAGFVASIEENVIAPMVATQELLVEREYITRLYTTMSAHEMDVDPVFGYNPVLGDVDNQHTATRVVECNLTVSQFEAPWRVALPSGLLVRGEGFGNWPVSTDDGMPANLQVLQDNGSGQPEVITDNTATVGARLAELNAGFPRLPMGEGCTCVAPGEGGLSWAAGLGLLGAVGVVFRRRRR